jgi:hypothetical protein
VAVVGFVVYSRPNCWSSRIGGRSDILFGNHHKPHRFENSSTSQRCSLKNHYLFSKGIISKGIIQFILISKGIHVIYLFQPAHIIFILQSHFINIYNQSLPNSRK